MVDAVTRYHKLPILTYVPILLFLTLIGGDLIRILPTFLVSENESISTLKQRCVSDPVLAILTENQLMSDKQMQVKINSFTVTNVTYNGSILSLISVLKTSKLVYEKWGFLQEQDRFFHV